MHVYTYELVHSCTVDLLNLVWMSTVDLSTRHINQINNTKETGTVLDRNLPRIPNLVSDLAGGVPRYFHINSDKINSDMGKSWSRYDLQNFRKRNCLGDDQGELSKGTVVEGSRPRWPIGCIEIFMFSKFLFFPPLSNCETRIMQTTFLESRHRRKIYGV